MYKSRIYWKRCFLTSTEFALTDIEKVTSDLLDVQCAYGLTVLKPFPLLFANWKYVVNGKRKGRKKCIFLLIQSYIGYVNLESTSLLHVTVSVLTKNKEICMMYVFPITRVW